MPPHPPPHLDHLGVQPLPHLHASVREQDRAVRVDVQQCPGLIEREEAKAEAVLGGGESQASLPPAVSSVGKGERKVLCFLLLLFVVVVVAVVDVSLLIFCCIFDIRLTSHLAKTNVSFAYTCTS